MKFEQFFKSWEGTRALNRILAAAVAAQALAIVGLGVLVTTQDRTVTMVPPDFQQQISIRRGVADPAFHESWGAYFAGVFGNVTPGNAEFIRRSVERLVCPEIYHEVVTTIERETQQMRNDRISTRFETRRVLYEEGSGKTFVHGQQVVDAVTGSQRRAERTFEFAIRVTNFMPELCGITSYQGPPRTLDVLERERQQKTQTRS